MTSKDTTTLSLSVSEKTSIQEMFEAMLGRFYLSTDRQHYSMDNLPLAVMTLMVNGKNTGSDDPSEVEVPIAIWDGLEEEDKICLLGRKKRAEIKADDYKLVKIFDSHKIKRIEKAFGIMLQGSGRSLPFRKAIYKDVNGFTHPYHAGSVENVLIEAIKKLEFPPLEGDRLYIKMRLISPKLAKV